MLKLEDIRQGAQVIGLVPGEIATIKMVEPIKKSTREERETRIKTLLFALNQVKICR